VAMSGMGRTRCNPGTLEWLVGGWNTEENARRRGVGRVVLQRPVRPAWDRSSGYLYPPHLSANVLAQRLLQRSVRFEGQSVDPSAVATGKKW
jgi:hypothetical protein